MVLIMHCDLNSGALEGLREKGVVMQADAQARLVSNLLVTICGDTKVQPTISLASNDSSQHYNHSGHM